MKRLTLSACLLCGLAAAAQTQPASVGIRTEYPQGVLHIDGASTTATTNPTTGTISALQASDDVVIDASGRLGAGRLEPPAMAPAVKVDIYAAAQGEALRIQDGTQDDGKVLSSEDALGTGSWAPPPLLPGKRRWFAFLSVATAGIDNASSRPYTTVSIVNYANSLISPVSLGSVDKTAGTITVPFTGKYLVTSDAATIARNSGGRFRSRFILYVHSGGGTKNSRWTPSDWGGGDGNFQSGVRPFFSNILELEESDVLSLSLDATLSVNAHYVSDIFFNVEFIQE